MSRKIVTASLLVLGLALSARADDVKPREKKETADKPVTVPFELLPTGHLAVNVKVNGKGPYLIIFDTGSPLTFFNNKLAKEAGLVVAAGWPADGWDWAEGVWERRGQERRSPHRDRRGRGR